MSTKLVSQRPQGNRGLIFFSLCNQCFSVREGAPIYQTAESAPWNLQGDNLSEIEKERRKRSHPWKSFVIKDFLSCLIMAQRDQLYNVYNLVVPSDSFLNILSILLVSFVIVGVINFSNTPHLVRSLRSLSRSQLHLTEILFSYLTLSESCLYAWDIQIAFKIH